MMALQVACWQGVVALRQLLLLLLLQALMRRLTTFPPSPALQLQWRACCLPWSVSTLLWCQLAATVWLPCPPLSRQTAAAAPPLQMSASFAPPLWRQPLLGAQTSGPSWRPSSA